MRAQEVVPVKILREESGQTLILTALCMTAMIGFMALALDVGTLFRARRNMQIAADAAAMAGTTEFFYNGASAVRTKAYAAAKANGVDNTVAGNVVSVTLPPVSIGGTSCATCVQVVVSTPNPTVFMGQFLGTSIVNVAATAVGGAPSASSVCMFVMSPSADDALWIHGAGSINASGCSVYVNSSQPDALCVTGSAGKSDLANIDVHGQQGSSGNCKGDPGVPVSQSVSVMTDPWENLPDPSLSCNSGNTTNLTTGTLTGTVAGPGYEGVACYSAGSCTTKKGVTTCTPAVANLTAATLGPGTYVFTTGVSITGNVVVGNGSPTTGTSPSGGATIAVSGTSSLNIDTASAFTIYAPADPTNTYNGVALYQTPTDTSAMQISFGSSAAVFDGMVYAPGAAVTLHDEGGGGLSATGLVVGTIYVNGKVSLTSYNAFNPVTTPFKVISLVE